MNFPNGRTHFDLILLLLLTLFAKENKYFSGVMSVIVLIYLCYQKYGFGIMYREFDF